ncbi:MAG: hybrid sensor histidine kinase/response regulator [Nitrospirae bacterium]|nr:MAG: hybrid sensor histidine kinase/response regulator [Nitrospirota bacterium]
MMTEKNKKNKGTVLVVDDDRDVLRITAWRLSEDGYDVTPCGKAADALTALQNMKCDVVVTDIVMPEMTGIELLEKIHETTPDMPVILMTGYVDFEKAVNAVKFKAFDFLIKPYTPEQIVFSVEKAIKYRRLIDREKEYKAMLEELNQELDTLLSERTMGLMALTIADKVRNPSTVIGWICKRIMEHDKISDSLRSNLNDILSESRKLETIVNDFEELNKSKHSVFVYDDLNEVIRLLVPILDKEAGMKNVAVDLQLSSSPLRINMQRHFMAMAIRHILRNSIDATPQGGTVRVTTSEANDRVVVTISDTGQGIPEDSMNKIFEPFYSTKSHRFGMGLPLVKQIISEHLGEISVESVIGKGSTFTITLPVRWLKSTP